MTTREFIRGLGVSKGVAEDEIEALVRPDPFFPGSAVWCSASGLSGQHVRRHAPRALRHAAGAAPRLDWSSESGEWYDRLEARQLEADGLLPGATRLLRAALQGHGLDGTLTGRVKSMSSAVKKMISEDIGPEALEDLLGFRIIVPDTADCYAVLDALHGEFEFRAESLDDYIANPKANGYQSLHSCLLLTPSAIPVEVQIRSRQMHLHAEHGAAHHVHYKRFRYSALADLELARAVD